jgi:hypothetical protein
MKGPVIASAGSYAQPLLNSLYYMYADGVNNPLATLVHCR